MILVEFEQCETQHCVNITIIDDLINEPEESFSYTLERTPQLGPAIHLNPVSGEVLIIDDDGKNYLLVWHSSKFFIFPADQPELVTFIVVNATAVRITWSGSTHLSTSLKYTCYFVSAMKRTAMSLYTIVLPASVNSADVTLIIGYEHVFTLQYLSDATPVTNATFVFGKRLIPSASFHFTILTFQIRNSSRFSLDQLTTV